MTTPTDDAPTVYVIAGPNGAGKTTFATRFLPEIVDCREFLNADLIATGLAPFAPETQNIRAARMLLTRFDEMAAMKEDFGLETTLSGKTYLRLLRDLRLAGYRVEASFLWLPTPELAVERVARRVKQRGHHVPESDVRRRFVSGLRNFFTSYRPLFDLWRLYDASQYPPRLIAQAVADIIQVFDEAAWNRVQNDAKGPS